jgi:hypothetical protein
MPEHKGMVKGASYVVFAMEATFLQIETNNKIYWLYWSTI